MPELPRDAATKMDAVFAEEKATSKTPKDHAG